MFIQLKSPPGYKNKSHAHRCVSCFIDLCLGERKREIDGLINGSLAVKTSLLSAMGIYTKHLSALLRLADAEIWACVILWWPTDVTFSKSLYSRMSQFLKICSYISLAMNGFVDNVFPGNTWRINVYCERTVNCFELKGAWNAYVLCKCQLNDWRPIQELYLKIHFNNLINVMCVHRKRFKPWVSATIQTWWPTTLHLLWKMNCGWSWNSSAEVRSVFSVKWLQTGPCEFVATLKTI